MGILQKDMMMSTRKVRGTAPRQTKTIGGTKEQICRSRDYIPQWEK